MAGGAVTVRPDVVQQDNEFTARLAARTMLRRIGSATEIGGSVLFPASQAASFVTGPVLMADGGWTAW